MTTKPVRLSEADIRRLAPGEGPDERAAVAQKFCRAAAGAELSDEDRRVAQDIIRMLAADTAELVRRAMAVTLRSSDLLPREVALRMARDVESVALPVLNASPVFTVDDLIEIVKAGSTARQIAVAEHQTKTHHNTAAVAIYAAEDAVAA